MPPSPGPDTPTDAGRARGPRAAAFFDIDNTIIRGASGYHLVRELQRRGFFSVADIAFFGRQALGYVLRGEDARQIGVVRERALGIIRHRSVAEMVAIAEDVYDEVLASKVFPGTRDLLERHRAAGHQVWLVTAGPQEVGDLVARRLGATGAVGTVAEERDGYYTGRLVGSMMHGSAKAAAARRIAWREGYDLDDCYAYGDSENDIPMLSAVGNPCAINPEPHLRWHCAEVGWPVRDFRRKRSTMRRKAARAAGAAGMAGLTALAWRSWHGRAGARGLR